MKGTPKGWKVGTIFRIKLSSNDLAYAQLLAFPYIRLFDGRGESEEDPAGITRRPMLFCVQGHKAILHAEHWAAVGVDPLSRNDTVATAARSRSNPNLAFVFQSDGTAFTIPLEQAKGLEPASIWDAGHIEDRIMDQYAGRESRWLAMARIAEGLP